MSMCRKNAGVCTVNGLLYVVGGDDGSCNLSTVEYYNPTTDKWTVVSSCRSSTGIKELCRCYSYLHYEQQKDFQLNYALRAGFNKCF
uniref:Uncharacterized protein n=1 Tax=Chelonoidis abingdonii TaxID=106734 RepID=A0A8C0GG23_CHEAB